MKTNYIYLIFALFALFVLSAFKDLYTPDYRNTIPALFLNNPPNGRLATLATHTLFWLKAIAYTSGIIISSTLCTYFYFKNKFLTQLTLITNIAFALLLFAFVLVNNPIIDVVVVSKLNRYLHSPIITLFLIAAYTITAKTTNDKPH